MSNFNIPGKISSIRLASHDYMYQEGDYKYIDSFVGSSCSSGEEVVYEVDPYWGGERVYQYELYGSKDNENWIKIGENMSEEYVSENGIAHEIHNEDSFAYIKLKGVKTRVVGRDDINNIHICEIEVFGNETNNLAYLKPVTSSGTDMSAESSKK